MSIDKNNEITVKVKGSFNKVVEILTSKGFKITDKFSLEDSYFVPKDILYFGSTSWKDISYGNPTDSLLIS